VTALFGHDVVKLKCLDRRPVHQRRRRTAEPGAETPGDGLARSARTNGAPSARLGTKWREGDAERYRALADDSRRTLTSGSGVLHRELSEGLLKAARAHWRPGASGNGVGCVMTDQ